jgi:hypothetical protein
VAGGVWSVEVNFSEIRPIRSDQDHNSRYYYLFFRYQ